MVISIAKKLLVISLLLYACLYWYAEFTYYIQKGYMQTYISRFLRLFH